MVTLGIKFLGCNRLVATLHKWEQCIKFLFGEFSVGFIER